MRIYLIGFMGAGKTTLGSQAATNLQVPFYDTDQMIEDASGLTIAKFFTEKGEDEFRKAEAKALRETIQFEKAIIATGGGLPIYHHNMEWLNEHGITMYLQWPEDLLLASLIHHMELRPMLANLSVEEAIQKSINLLNERTPVYEQSSMTIQMSGDIDNDLKLLEKACKYIW